MIPNDEAIAELRSFGWDVSGPSYEAAPIVRPNFREVIGRKRVAYWGSMLIDSYFINDRFGSEHLERRRPFMDELKISNVLLHEWIETKSRLRVNKFSGVLAGLDVLLDKQGDTPIHVQERVGLETGDELYAVFEGYRELDFSGKVETTKKFDEILYGTMERVSWKLVKGVSPDDIEEVLQRDGHDCWREELKAEKPFRYRTVFKTSIEGLAVIMEELGDPGNIKGGGGKVSI